MAAGRLLIVDDDDTVGQILMAAAAQCGFEARLCATLADVSAALSTWAPTHVSLDLSLPTATPVQLLQQIAAAGARPAIIVCSGAGAADQAAVLDQARALGLPVTGALSKPFRIAALRSLLAA